MKLTFTSWPSGNTFALAEELRSLGLEGVHFEGSYDTETRNGALIFEVPS